MCLHANTLWTIGDGTSRSPDEEDGVLTGMFATAVQIPKLHALNIAMVCFKQQDTQVHLGLLMNFVAKNQMPNQSLWTN